MRRRLAVAGAAVLALVSVATGTAALLAGADDGAGAGVLVWVDGPRVLTPPALPGDRVMYGQLRNDGLHAVTLKAAQVRVLDRAGHRVKSNARFLQAFAPGRHGEALTLGPGRTAPLTVAWRGAGARKVTIGAVTLPLP